MNGDVETVRPLEVLHRAAKKLDARLVLVATADMLNARGRRFISDEPGSRLRQLAVVRPEPHASTGALRLRLGTVIASASVEELPIDVAASKMLETLAPRLRSLA